MRRRLPSALVGLVALAALAACGGGAGLQPPGPRRAATQLDRGEVRAIAEALRFEDARRYDAYVFEQLATDPEVEVRRRAAIAAGRIGDPAAVPLLVKLLDDDPSPAVRADAAFALGELGDSSGVVLESLRGAVPSGWVPVRAGEVPIAVEVLAALAKIGTGDARLMVEDALREADPGRRNARRVAAQALLSIGFFETGGGRVRAAARYLDNPDPELRWRAAYALMRLGGADAARSLLPLLEDADHRARAYAARGLTAEAADSAGLRPRAMAGLQAALSDHHAHVRINAVRALAGYGDDAPVDAMAILARDPDPNVAIAAVDALGSIGDRSLPALRTVRDEVRAPLAVRTAVLRQLARLERPAAQPTLDAVRRLASGSDREQYAAARILAALGPQRGLPIAETLVRQDDARVAVAALVALGQLAADSAGTAPTDALRRVLLPQLRHTDPRRRAAALRALQPLLGPGDLDDVLAVFAGSRGDSTAVPAALAALDAVARLDSLRPGAARELFRRFPAPANRWVRRRAAALPGQGWGAAPAAVAADGNDLYVEIARRYIAEPLAHGHRPRARVETDAGTFVLELIPDEAPLTVRNFVDLASAGFFDGGVWHRVVPNFVAQDGAPAGDPEGGPGPRIRDEINRLRYLRGAVGMALAGPDTGGSQWFVTLSPQPHLDGGYTVFGRVVEGMETVDRVVEGAFIQSIRIDG